MEAIDVVVERAGRLAGAGIVGIIKKMEMDDQELISGRRIVVAMDGGLYENYPRYREYMKNAVTELIGPQASVSIVLDHSKDGSGIGAALLAAAHSKFRD